MGRLLPIRSTVSPRPDREPRLVEIDDDAADEVFEALSSKTARTIFSTLHETPATASDLAEAADTSLQNVRYHLDKLVDAGLVESTDTWYSDRGREMKVYEPVNTSLVMMSGETPPESTLRSLLENLVGGIGILVIASLGFDWIVNRLAPAEGRIVSTSLNRTTATGTPVQTTTVPSGDGGIVSPTPRVETVAATRTVVNDSAANATATTTPSTGMGGGVVIEVLGFSVPPGAIFFIGGLFVLLLALGWHHRWMAKFGG